MIELKDLTEILSKNESLVVTETNEGILISEKANNIIPVGLANFVNVYEKEQAIKNEGSGFVITVTRMSSSNFMKLLESVFAADYDFSVVGEYEIKATPKSANEDLNEATPAEKKAANKSYDKCSDKCHELEGDAATKCYEKCKQKKADYLKRVSEELEEFETFEEMIQAIAEEIDSEDISIELHEDGMIVESKDLQATAELIDGLAEDLEITITNENIVVTQGE